MKHLFLLLICSTFFADTLGDVVCGPKKTSKKITLKSGEEVSFSTQAGDSYGKGVKCFAQFRRGRKDKCKLSFSCDSFELTAATSTCKKRSDFFLINKKRYCKQNGPDVSVDGRSMKVAFKSHRRSKGGAGATCTASCVSTAATTSAPGTPGTPGQCCSSCSTDYQTTPPYSGTVHEFPETITTAEATTYTGVTYTGTATIASMWGANGWDSSVLVHQITAEFSDSQSVTVNCDQGVGSQQDCLEYAEKFSRSLGRVPLFSRSATTGLDLRPGDYNSPSGCNAWGGGGVITMCVGVGDTIMQAGNFEELMLHEGAHVTLDPNIYGTEGWNCARNLDNNFISTYAKASPGSEDVAESLVPWYAWKYSADRFQAATINTIAATIPNRLSLFTELFASERFLYQIQQQLNATRPKSDGKDIEAPHVLGDANLV